MTENILVRHAKTICKVQSPSKVLVFRLFSTPFGRLWTPFDSRRCSVLQLQPDVATGLLRWPLLGVQCLGPVVRRCLLSCFGSGGFLTWPVPPKHPFFCFFWIFHDQPQSHAEMGYPPFWDTSIWPSSLLWFTCEAPEAEW